MSVKIQINFLEASEVKQLMSTNLTHMAEQVKVNGPLWTHSAFGFEAMIAHTLKGFRGTRGVSEQVLQ